MKQKADFKPGLLRLLIILVPLLTLFSALILISRHNPPLTKKTPLCPFLLTVLPPSENTEPPRLSGKTERPSDRPPHFNGDFSSTPIPNKKINFKPGKIYKSKASLQSEALSSFSWLRDIRFFQSVLRDFNTENRPSLELLFYLPLHLTKDKRWLVSANLSPLPTKQPLPQTASTAKKLASGNISQLTLQEIQKHLSSHPPLTLQDLLRKFPKQKWFLHLMTDNIRVSVENLTDQKEPLSKFHITSNNEKLLDQLSKNRMTVIYNFRSLLRFQLLRVFLVEKLFSFPGQGLIIPSHLPLSLSTVKRMRHSGQWLFLKKETHIEELPPQILSQVKGVITREWKPALKWIQNKNPCL